MSWHIIPLDSLAEFAASLVSDNPNAPQYECDYCGGTEDSYRYAHDDAVAAMVAFIEHTAFDHTGRANILRRDISVIGRVAHQGEPLYEDPEGALECPGCEDPEGARHAADCPKVI